MIKHCLFWESTRRFRNASGSSAGYVTGITAAEDIAMTILLPILLIVLPSIIGYYFMDHCGDFMEKHYKASSDIPVFLPVFRKRKNNAICGKITLRTHLFRRV